MDPESGIRVLAPRGLISYRITITTAEPDKGIVIARHTNPGFEWAYLIKGEAVINVAKRYGMGEGDAIFYDAHFSHSIEAKEKIQ